MSLFSSPKKNKSPKAKTVPANPPQEFPVIALRNNVIYPSTVVPVFFEDKASLAALEFAQKNGNLIGAFTLAEEARKKLEAAGESEQEQFDAFGLDVTEPPAPANTEKSVKDLQVDPKDLYRVGTICKIHRVMPITGKSGMMGVLQGFTKVQALELKKEKRFITGILKEVRDEVQSTKEVKALMKNALGTAQKIIQNTPYLPQELQMALGDLSDPLKFVYLLATLIRFDVSEKQLILEENSVEEKLKKTAAIFSRELEQIELGGKIVSNVKKEFGKMSREAFLRQQLKEIQRELGEENETQMEANEYREKLAKAKLPDEVVKEVKREIDRLANMHPQASEYQVVRTYLDWIFDLSWEHPDQKKLQLKEVEKVLENDHYGLGEVKERVLEYLAVRELNREHKGPILCFVGPPGVGKTSLGKSIARALGREFVRMSLGGMKDEAEIRGHRRTYVGAMPGRIIQGIKRAGSSDPVFMLDEIDKVGNDFRGDPSSALLEVLDPEQNDTFRDHYLDVDYDLSNVLFIATANILDSIQPALLDRMEIINLSGYTNEEKLQIGKKFLWPRVVKRHGLKASRISMKDDILELLIEEYTREAGVRNFEKELAKLARKAAYLVVQGKQKSLTLNKAKIREFLGPQRVYPEIASRTAQPGVVTGLAYTQAGGTILFVEAAKMPGGKHLNMTGSLGEVMKESARAALSLVRARSQSLGIKGDFFKTYDIHLHAPAGAVPKDGPSAGVAMFTALVSLLTEKKVRNDVAMTGEITLTGQVLPIGGVKEKVLAAKRAGIKVIILPEKNQNDVNKIDKALVKGLDFKYVHDVEQVIDIAIKQTKPRPSPKSK